MQRVTIDRGRVYTWLPDSGVHLPSQLHDDSIKFLVLGLEIFRLTLRDSARVPQCQDLCFNAAFRSFRELDSVHELEAFSVLFGVSAQ